MENYKLISLTTLVVLVLTSWLKISRNDQYLSRLYFFHADFRILRNWSKSRIYYNSCFVFNELKKNERVKTKMCNIR